MYHYRRKVVGFIGPERRSSAAGRPEHGGPSDLRSGKNPVVVYQLPAINQQILLKLVRSLKIFEKLACFLLKRRINWWVNQR